MGSPVRTDTAPILIADDDDAVRASLALLLKQAGYRTHAVGTPDAAIEWLAQHPCALVLQDMNFSRRTSGDEGLELLRAHPRGASAAAGDPDHGVGIDLAGGGRHAARRRRLRHQALDQPGAAAGGADGAAAGRHGQRPRRRADHPRGPRRQLRLRRDRQRRRADAEAAAAGRPRRRHRCLGADHGRERHRQGADRRCAAPQQPPPQEAVRQGEPRRHLGLAVRERDVRARARRLHRCAARPAGTLRPGRRRHHLPRRDRRPRRLVAGEVAARAAGPDLRGARLEPAADRRRARGRRPPTGRWPTWCGAASSARICCTAST